MAFSGQRAHDGQPGAIYTPSMYTLLCAVRCSTGWNGNKCGIVSRRTDGPRGMTETRVYQHSSRTRQGVESGNTARNIIQIPGHRTLNKHVSEQQNHHSHCYR
ncbi:hypothetical protein KIL84_010893 [Mauremys mutica]|uniref:Uncharacterized protein n=1 Tax=Mauremys mutica TaxID=74926 RepID=A0A9D3XCP8_9SAUR|nr:hypothetical protein KIL84_010893 [Mauremys mutica]